MATTMSRTGTTEHLAGSPATPRIEVDPPESLPLDPWLRALLRPHPASRVHVVGRHDLSGDILHARATHTDTIVCAGVLEYQLDDRAALRALHAALPPDGRLLVMVPAYMCLYGPADRAAGRLRRYPRPAFRARALAAGFEVEELRYVDVAGFFSTWFGARVLGRAPERRPEDRRFAHRARPVRVRLDRSLSGPLGASLVAVLRRR